MGLAALFFAAGPFFFGGVDGWVTRTGAEAPFPGCIYRGLKDPSPSLYWGIVGFGWGAQTYRWAGTSVPEGAARAGGSVRIQDGDSGFLWLVRADSAPLF